jgi:predicted SnoaL-like aldol condensation-catalyzing enzyme
MNLKPAIAALLAISAALPGAAQVVSSAAAQQALLLSPDPKLAANKKLVYDMYRAIVQGGHAEMVERFFTPEYLQHNPNVASGRDALAAFLRGSRPARPIADTITLPILNIVAERDIVMVMSERPMKDAEGKSYVTTWFDTYRIVDGKIHEHWDPALKDPAMLKFDPNNMGK